MKLYRRVWRCCWTAVGAIGVGLAALQWSPLVLLVTLVLLVAFGSLVKAMLPEQVRGSGRTSSGRTSSGPRRRPLPHALTIAVGIVTVWSESQVSPSLGLLVVLTASLSSPILVERLVGARRRPASAEPRGRRASPPPPMESASDPDADVGEVLTGPEAMGPLKGLDDRQLCRLWRESFWALRRPQPPGTVLRLVALREACLDELERRDSVALHAWLDAGARASGGPEKYLSHPRPRGPEAA